ncbi:hypothetical protein B566_EDAN001458 [Ephemera danica]|nr:hypothetical protein B566_EDAN001458 [Ephemera danica]
MAHLTRYQLQCRSCRQYEQHHVTMASNDFANPANVLILLCVCKSRGCREVPACQRRGPWCGRPDEDEDLLFDSLRPPPYELPTLPGYEEVQDPPPPYTVSEMCETQEEAETAMSGPHTEIYFS